MNDLQVLERGVDLRLGEGHLDHVQGPGQPALVGGLGGRGRCAPRPSGCRGSGPVRLSSVVQGGPVVRGHVHPDDHPVGVPLLGDRQRAVGVRRREDLEPVAPADLDAPPAQLRVRQRDEQDPVPGHDVARRRPPPAPGRASGLRRPPAGACVATGPAGSAAVVPAPPRNWVGR